MGAFKTSAFSCRISANEICRELLRFLNYILQRTASRRGHLNDSQFLRRSVTTYRRCAMSTPCWQAVSSRSVPTDVSAHRSEGIKQWTGSSVAVSDSAATYSMHTLCTTQGRLCATATCARNIPAPDYHVACYVYCSAAKKPVSSNGSMQTKPNKIPPRQKPSCVCDCVWVTEGQRGPPFVLQASYCWRKCEPCVLGFVRGLEHLGFANNNIPDVVSEPIKPFRAFLLRDPTVFSR